ncbi:hypothetical protein Tco_1475982 [Tanacetum coccineum]
MSVIIMYGSCFSGESREGWIAENEFVDLQRLLRLLMSNSSVALIMLLLDCEQNIPAAFFESLSPIARKVVSVLFGRNGKHSVGRVEMQSGEYESEGKAYEDE